MGDKLAENLRALYRINDIVCEHHNIGKLLITQEKISKKNMLIRQKIIYLYWHTVPIDRLALTTIGAWFGGMKIENVENAVQVVQDRMESDRDYKKEIEALKSKLK